MSSNAQFKLLTNDLISHIKNQDPIFIGVLVSFFIVLITILYFSVLQRKHKQGVLIVGLCDSGKTVLFFRLVYKKWADTQTSIKENVGPYSITGKNQTYQLIDLPGHEKVRWQKFDNFKEQARALIFAVDSSTIQRDIKDVAELLYTLLTDTTVTKNSLKVLVACNKTDLALAKGSLVIKSMLEKEINLLRTTKSAALSGTHDTGDRKVFLGKKGKDFEFSDLRTVHVDFAECSGRGNKDNQLPQLDDVTRWLEKL